MATDRSETAHRAVEWAAEMAERYGAELVVLRVTVDGVPSELVGDLAEYAAGIGENVRPLVRRAEDPAEGIVRRCPRGGRRRPGGRQRRDARPQGVPARQRANRVSHNAPLHRGHRQHGIGAVTREPEVDASRLLGPRGRDRPRDRAPRPARAAAAPTRDRARAASARRSRSSGRRSPSSARCSRRGPDLLPPEFIEELAALQDDVPPLSEAEVVAVMEEELGVPWEDVFESIDPAPLAAGTIAQVHRARRSTAASASWSRCSARPRESEILHDLGLLELFAEKTRQPARRSGAWSTCPPCSQHLSDSLRRELDFTQEAREHRAHPRGARAASRGSTCRACTELYTRARLLVMEEVAAACPSRRRRRARRAARRPASCSSATTGRSSTEGFFHADPHPGQPAWADGQHLVPRLRHGRRARARDARRSCCCS